VAAALPVITACGPEAEHIVRLTVEGTREGEALDIELGHVEMGSGVEIYAALFHIGSVAMSSDVEEEIETNAINVNLFTPTVVGEFEFDGSSLTAVALDLPRPDGDGVRRGESLSVVVAGTLAEVPFEYRDESMLPLTFTTTRPLGAETVVAAIRFDMKQWFAGIDDEGLILTGGTYIFDATHNQAAAAVIEAAIRASASLDASAVVLCVSCDDL
jgi:hypothetical protein